MATAFACPTPNLCALEPPTPAVPDVLGASPSQKQQFAFARIKDDIHLVQVYGHTPGSASSALAAIDVDVFRHEFITIFRYSHRDTFHPTDIHIIESIDDEHALYEEDRGQVFLAKGVVERLRNMTEQRRFIPPRVSNARSRYFRRA